jgi:DHA2 family multidrug resistance protein-like MFS transporter
LLGQTLGAALVAVGFHISTQHGASIALWMGVGFSITGAVASGLRLLPAR